MTRLTWDQFFQGSIQSSKKGIFYANRQIEELIKNNPVGFYQYTKLTAYNANEYKCGQSGVNVLERISQQREASEREPYLIVGFQPSERAKNDSEDQKILRKMHDDKKCCLAHVIDPTRSSKEWAVFENDNAEELWFDYLSNDIEKRDLSLTIWQLEALDKFVTLLGDNKKKIMAELAARFGKTLLYLSLFDSIDKQVMVVGSYYLTALSSFKKEVCLYKQFSNVVVLDLSSNEFQDEFVTNLTLGKKILIVASLCGDKEGDTIRNSNASIVSKFANKITVIDEADYGAHTESCVPFVNLIGANAPIILTTGTNSERAKGTHDDVDSFFKVTYLDMLMKALSDAKLQNELKYERATKFENNLAQVKFYRYDWSRFASALNEDMEELNPSFSKCSEDVNRNRGFWTGLYKSFADSNEDVDANNYALDKCLEDDEVGCVMQFVSMTNKQLGKLQSIAKPILKDQFEVISISGDVVEGKHAERYVKDVIRAAEESGKKTWIIASQMCQRSFSIPEINTVILTYDNGDIGATVQKMSRALTAGSKQKTGHIISMSIDGNRDDKIATMIMDAAKQVAEHDEVDFVNGLRKVMRTLPIFQMGDDGYNIELKVDEYSKEVFSSTNSQRIMINNDRLMYNGCLDDINNNSDIETKLKIESEFKKGKTFVDPKKVNRSSTPEENSIIAERRNKLKTILDRTAYCVTEIRKHQNINFNNFVNIVKTNRFVTETIGVTPQEFMMLLEQKYIDSSLLSMYVECAK